MTAVADKTQPFDVLFAVQPVVRSASFRLRQQAFFFIKAYGPNLSAGYFCNFAYLHFRVPNPVKSLDSIAAIGSNFIKTIKGVGNNENLR